MIQQSAQPPRNAVPDAVKGWHLMQANRCNTLARGLAPGPAYRKALAHWHNSHRACIARR